MLNKVCGIPRQNTGVGWYRIVQPMMGLSRMGIKISSTKFTGTNEVATVGKISNSPAINDKTLMQLAKGADVIWSTVILDYDEILKMLDLRKWSGAKWAVDIDDDMYNVSSANPMRKNVDALIGNIEMCLYLADGLTVSVPRLKDVYSHLNPNIYINPNTQDISEWNKLYKKPSNKLRIGWRGASGHAPDIAMVEPAIAELKKKYDITFVTMGVCDTESEHHNWVNCMDYPERLASLDLDIAVVPLIDSPYNQCKSNIAIQEFGALRIPVVASPTENQKNMPILYAKNNYQWYENLEKLIKDKEKRQKMGRELHKFVKNNYSLKEFTPKLAEWMEKLPRKDHKPR